MTGEKDGEEEVTVSGLTSVSQLCQNISSVQVCNWSSSGMVLTKSWYCKYVCRYVVLCNLQGY